MGFGRLLFFFFLLLISTTSSASGSSRVKLDFYYETLCPYCSNFIVNYLSKIFQNGLISIVDLHLVPYGNARLDSNNTITCQHGPYECLLNTVEACAIDTWPNVHDHFTFIYCVEVSVLEHKYMEWESCFQKLTLDAQPIGDCYKSGYGGKLELQYAAETNALIPPHTYVPWVLVDGQPLYEDYENFESYICKAYEGVLPEACNSLSLETILTERKSHQDGICHPGKTIRPPATSVAHEVKMKRSK